MPTQSQGLIDTSRTVIGIGVNNSTDELDGMSHEQFISFLKNQGYMSIKQLEDGEWVALLPMMFSLSVCCGISALTAFKYRWCFKNPDDAKEFYASMVEFDDIPTKTDSLVGHRYSNNAPLLRMKNEQGLDKW